MRDRLPASPAHFVSRSPNSVTVTGREWPRSALYVLLALVAVAAVTAVVAVAIIDRS